MSRIDPEREGGKMTDGSHSARYNHGRRNILVVEDELINREILGMMLQDSYNVVFADTGKRALEILGTDFSSLSIVLLDLNLPDMSGIEILRFIKGNVCTAMLPVIVMTADQDSEVECLTIGATDFISKPYPKQEIVLARIRRTIELFEDRDLIRWTERDNLTGLFNRDFFYRYASRLDTLYPNDATDAIMLDINHFHMINERYGRKFCDRVLKLVAEKLLGSVREPEGIVCRKEDDTFLIYCLHRSDYKKILDDICIHLDDYQVRARMGVYPNVDRGIDMEHRFDYAKQAADTVKSSYSQAVGFYDNSMHEKELYAEQLLEDFHAAIREKQFFVCYQPKYDVRSAEPVLAGAEALVRWRHPKLGMTSMSSSTTQIRR